MCSLQGELLDVELMPPTREDSGGVTVLRMRRPRDFSYRQDLVTFMQPLQQ